MSGILFKNEKKEQPNHPDYRGDGMINGVPVWISGWVKRGQKGPFVSLAFRLKGEAKADPISTGRPDDMDGDTIPF